MNSQLVSLRPESIDPVEFTVRTKPVIRLSTPSYPPVFLSILVPSLPTHPPPALDLDASRRFAKTHLTILGGFTIFANGVPVISYEMMLKVPGFLSAGVS